jgi:hypothetical protein
MTAIHVYCGPTITGAEVRAMLPAAIIHPPVRHGDLLRLKLSPGDIVVIIDGVFHHEPPARHKEILELLAGGARVVGAASMGALRAAELQPYGMTGVGDIFRAYRDGSIVADDEVAVAHLPDDGHRQLSLALVDIRAIAAVATSAGALRRGEAEHVVSQARALHYSSRTWLSLQHAAIAQADPGLEDAVRRLARWHAANPGAGAKHADAVTALEMVATGHLPPPAVPDPCWPQGPWQNFHLRHWLVRYRGSVVDGTDVSLLAALHHQRLYDPGFPGRWRSHVMSWIGGALPPAPGASAGGTEARALAAVEAAGLSLSHLSRPQIAYWLTPAEITGVPPDEQLARLVVRSVPHDPGAALLWPVTEAEVSELVDTATGKRSAAAARRLNDEAASSGPHRTMDSLRADLIRSHLADRWGVDPSDSACLTAAARDRGFSSAGGAAGAARRFFLLMRDEPAPDRAGIRDPGVAAQATGS